MLEQYQTEPLGTDDSSPLDAADRGDDLRGRCIRQKETENPRTYRFQETGWVFHHHPEYDHSHSRGEIQNLAQQLHGLDLMVHRGARIHEQYVAPRSSDLLGRQIAISTLPNDGYARAAKYTAQTFTQRRALRHQEHSQWINIARRHLGGSG